MTIDAQRSKAARRLFRIGAVALVGLLAAGVAARAELAKVRVATQFGLAYLPLIVMEHEHLWERYAKERGIDVKVDYFQLGGGSGLNDAILSGSVEVAAGGLAPMLAVWDKTITSQKVEGLSAINTSPMDILTNRADVRSLKDLKPDDKIALPAIRVSIQAIALAAAARREFGDGGFDRLDNQAVAMQHPDALSALLASRSEIAAYVSSSPFQERALKDPRIHKITDSFEAFGGPSTFAVAYVREAFVTNNPKITAAYYDAFRTALEMIARDHAKAVEMYVETIGDTTEPGLLKEILDRPDFTFSVTPSNTLKMASLMKQMKLMKNTPADWKSLFVQPLHDRSGS